MFTSAFETIRYIAYYFTYFTLVLCEMHTYCTKVNLFALHHVSSRLFSKRMKPELDECIAALDEMMKWSTRSNSKSITMIFHLNNIVSESWLTPAFIKCKYENAVENITKFHARFQIWLISVDKHHNDWLIYPWLLSFESEFMFIYT